MRAADDFCRARACRRAVPSGVRPADKRRPCLNSAHRAFSLIEVVAAVGIFAVGVVAVIGLLAPVLKSVASASEAEAAARVAGAVLARLQTMPFATAATYLQDAATVQKNDLDPTYNPNDGIKHPLVLFGKLNGEVGTYDTTQSPKTWYYPDFTAVDPRTSFAPVPRPMNDADKFFEIELIRNDTLSPKGSDDMAPMLAFSMRVRWPSFVAASSGAAVQVGASPGTAGPVPFDQSKKQVLFFSGSITR